MENNHFLLDINVFLRFRGSSITLAACGSVPAELCTSFSRLIFIRTAIDFNDSVNRHTLTPLSASTSCFFFSLSLSGSVRVLLCCFIALFNNNVCHSPLLYFRKCADKHKCDWSYICGLITAEALLGGPAFIVRKSTEEKNKRKTLK